MVSEDRSDELQAIHGENGAAILDDVTAFLRHYSVYPDEHCAPAYALWIAHTYAATSFYVTPRIIFSSPEPGSGKTRDLELGALLAHSAKMIFSASPAALYRRIAAAEDEGKLPPSIFYDEADALFGRGSTPQVEDMRALFNAGYKRGATVDRCEGDAKNMAVREFPVFAPLALAGLAGNMPATLTTRAITVHKRKRAPGEKVHPFRERDAAEEAAPIRDDLAAWISSIATQLAEARPTMPAGVEDRPAEVWEALLAIADAAGGHWPVTARAACKHFVIDTSKADPSLGVRLLTDCKEIFGSTDRMTTTMLVTELRRIEEAPWADMHGKQIDARKLAELLKPYGVTSRNQRYPDGSQSKGYAVTGEGGFRDAWLRYVESNPDMGVTGVPDVTPQVSGGTARDTCYSTEVTTDSAVPPLTSEVTEVTPVTGNTGQSHGGHGGDATYCQAHPATKLNRFTHKCAICIATAKNGVIR